MLFMNDHDILTAIRLAPSGSNLERGALTLSNLADWANENSDGWAYWPKPSKAAAKLQELLTERLGHAWQRSDIDDCTERELVEALRPVKAFLTRQGVDHAAVLA